MKTIYLQLPYYQKHLQEKDKGTRTCATELDSDSRTELDQ